MTRQEFIELSIRRSQLHDVLPSIECLLCGSPHKNVFTCMSCWRRHIQWDGQSLEANINEVYDIYEKQQQALIVKDIEDSIVG